MEPHPLVDTRFPFGDVMLDIMMILIAAFIIVGSRRTIPPTPTYCLDPRLKEQLAQPPVPRPTGAPSLITQRALFSPSSPPPPSPPPSPPPLPTLYPALPNDSSATDHSFSLRGLFYIPRWTLQLFENGEAPPNLHTVLLLPCSHICELLVVFWDEVGSWTCPVCGEEVREVVRQAEN